MSIQRTQSVGGVVALLAAITVVGCQYEAGTQPNSRELNARESESSALSDYVVEGSVDRSTGQDAVSHFVIGEGAPVAPRSVENAIQERNTANRVEGGSKGVAPRIYDPNYTPLSSCITVDLNTLYNFTPASGNYYCFYFEVDDESRTEFVALSQSAGRQVDVSVYHDEPANYTLSLVGTSTESGTDDSVLHFTEAGHYYMEMYAVSADGNQVQFAAASNTNVDAYEPNDDVPSAHQFSDDINYAVGNLDYPEDVDYFRMVSDNGQDLFVRLEDVYGTDEWILEILNGSTWVELDSNVRYSLSGFGTSSSAYVRVMQRPMVTHDQNHFYTLNMGARIMAIDDVDVGTTEQLARLVSGTTDPYLTTQVHNELNWNAKLEDSTGNGIEGAEVRFHYDLPTVGQVLATATADSSGYVSESETLPDCEGEYTIVHEYPYSPLEGVWETDFDVGGWWMTVPESLPDDEVGVGGENVTHVWMGHICTQTLQ